MPLRDRWCTCDPAMKDQRPGGAHAKRNGLRLEGKRERRYLPANIPCLLLRLQGRPCRNDRRSLNGIIYKPGLCPIGLCERKRRHLQRRSLSGEPPRRHWQGRESGHYDSPEISVLLSQCKSLTSVMFEWLRSGFQLGRTQLVSMNYMS